jgi:phage recombination protein Bet
MTTDLAVIDHGNSLALNGDQSYWNDQQLAVLRHMGVENAPEGDLMVFHHICQRTGLDPFARQIHMIGRNAKDQRTNQWVTKYTIQTGIDGFRLIGRRAANATGQTISVEAPEWAAEDGTWRPVWSPKWGFPIAARVTIKRGGEPFTAVALFDEYKQTKRDGGLTSMWAQRPAGQLAKCAEALAWRMAFPQDLAGLYTDDEMGQAHSEPVPQHVPAEQTGAQRMGAMLGQTAEPEPEGSPAMLDTASPLAKAMFAAMGDAGITDREDRLDYVSGLVGRAVTSSAEMTEDDARAVLTALDSQTGATA